MKTYEMAKRITEDFQSYDWYEYCNLANDEDEFIAQVAKDLVDDDMGPQYFIDSAYDILGNLRECGDEELAARYEEQIVLLIEYRDGTERKPVSIEDMKLRLFEKCLELEHKSERESYDGRNYFEQSEGAYAMLTILGLSQEYITWSFKR